jgi:uncharacterized RDD family membrane protein YckC
LSAGNFKVIGGDGREYVADGLDELRSWVADGRVGGETLVWSAEDASWRRAGDRPELRWDLPQAPPRLPQQTAPPTGFLPSGPEAVESEPAGFGVRLAAGAMDLLLVMLLFNVLSIPWAEELRGMQAAATAEAGKAVPDMALLLHVNATLFVPLLLLRSLYTAAFHAWVGATPGKLALGLKLVAMNGGKPGLGRVLLRTLLETITLATLGIGFGVMMLGGDGRALHDLLAGTRVVRRPR